MGRASVLGLERAVCRSCPFSPQRVPELIPDALFSIGDGLDALRLLIAALSVAASVAYFGFLQLETSLARTSAKTVVFAVLAILPLLYLPSFPDKSLALILLAAALFLSALGDLFLALEAQGKFFVLGLGSFLLAHVVYVIGFIPYLGAPSMEALVAMAACGGAATTLVIRLWPKLGSMRMPVLAYFAVIMVMVVCALSVPQASVALGLGAVTFALSDSLIAVRKFMRPFAGVNEAIWVTYIIAQFLITGAMLSLVLAA
jgi:uncharacterized membrane protein YhhN